jgi:CBS domain-containing protein
MDPPVVAPDAPVDDALDRLAQGATRVVYVVDGGNVRVIDLHAAKSVWSARARGDRGGATRAGEIARDVPIADPGDSLPALSEKLWAVDWGEVPVVDPGPPPRLCGVVTRRDVLGAFDREVLQRDVLVTRVVWFEGQRETADFLELPPGQRVELIAAPAAMVGHVLDLGAIHARAGVTVLAVRRARGPDGGRLVDPAPGERIEEGDRLLVKGLPDAIERLRASEASR